MKKYEWMPTECAPKNYPVEIYKGEFYLDDAKTKSIYIPSGKVVNNSWGEGLSTHVSGDLEKQVPKHLRIAWFSYTENKFYLLDTPLPHKKIDSIFSKGSYNWTEKKQDYSFDLSVGMAPGGKLTLFMLAPGYNVNVASFLAEETNKIPWIQFLKMQGGNTDIKREELLKVVLDFELTPEFREQIKDIGIPYGLWDAYETKYTTQLQFKSPGRKLKYLITHHLNGELNTYRNKYLNTLKDKQSWAGVHKIGLGWQSPEGEDYGSVFTFKKEQVLDVYNETNTDNVSFVIDVQGESRDSVKIYIKSGEYQKLLIPIDTKFWKE